MSETIVCPVCLNAEGFTCKTISSSLFECDICGRYMTDYALWQQARDGENNIGHWDLTSVQRAVLSHRIRTRTSGRPANESDVLLITPDLLDSLRSSALLPSPTAQAANIVRFVGDRVSRSGESIPQLPDHFHATIGALSRESAVQLMRELEEQGIIKSGGTPTFGHTDPTVIDLSLDGWELYEAQKRGSFEGNYGFIAMQFGDRDLDDFVLNVVKPTVKTATNCDLVDMRDVARAGVIDNIMREKIREARFVIADLTHGNRGAYWEAGYAEGRGIPVIYICEKKKFKNEKTHFDTNHCTTVTWSRNDDEGFIAALTATLHRSLDPSE